MAFITINEYMIFVDRNVDKKALWTNIWWDDSLAQVVCQGRGGHVAFNVIHYNCRRYYFLQLNAVKQAVGTYFLHFSLGPLGRSATHGYGFVHGHVHILIPKPWGLHFCIFHLGTSSAFSATQRYRFVHGHVHILIPKPRGLHFCIFHLEPLVPSVLLSAMDMFIF